MAETTGSATGLEDFFAKFLTWVGTQTGWTVDQLITTVDSGRQCAISKGNLFVQFRWDTSAPDSVIMYQSTAFDGVGVRAGLHTGDSGNGYNSNNSTTESSIESERCIQDMGDNAYPNYYFYSNAAGDYLHVAVEVNTDEFRHFGCGNLERFGDWDTAGGGEYAYGHYNVLSSSATGTSQTCLLDGAASSASGSGSLIDRCATMRMSGWPGQTTEVWAHVWGNLTTNELNDSAGNPRLKVLGGFRGGFNARSFGWLGPGLTSGLAPTQPIDVKYLDRTAGPPEHVYLMGFMPDVRGVHMRYLAPGDTFALGGQIWRVFPQVRRAEGSAQGDTDFSGIAYLTNP